MIDKTVAKLLLLIESDHMLTGKGLDLKSTSYFITDYALIQIGSELQTDPTSFDPPLFQDNFSNKERPQVIMSVVYNQIEHGLLREITGRPQRIDKDSKLILVLLVQIIRYFTVDNQ